MHGLLPVLCCCLCSDENCLHLLFTVCNLFWGQGQTSTDLGLHEDVDGGRNISSQHDCISLCMFSEFLRHAVLPCEDLSLMFLMLLIRSVNVVMGFLFKSKKFEAVFFIFDSLRLIVFFFLSAGKRSFLFSHEGG